MALVKCLVEWQDSDEDIGAAGMKILTEASPSGGEWKQAHRNTCYTVHHKWVSGFQTDVFYRQNCSGDVSADSDCAVVQRRDVSCWCALTTYLARVLDGYRKQFDGSVYISSSENASSGRYCRFDRSDGRLYHFTWESEQADCLGRRLKLFKCLHIFNMFVRMSVICITVQAHECRSQYFSLSLSSFFTRAPSAFDNPVSPLVDAVLARYYESLAAGSDQTMVLVRDRHKIDT